MIKKYSIDKVKPKNGSNVIAWDVDGNKTTCYYVGGQFKKKYHDHGDVMENVEWWAYAILDDRQSFLFDQFACLMALSFGEAQVGKWSSEMKNEQLAELLTEIKDIKGKVFEYYKGAK